MTTPILHERITVATRVTIMRILGVPVFITCLIYYTLSIAHGEPREELRVAALMIFVVVALTDALDGYLARSRNEITRLGRVLDPLADKALLVSGLILLTRPSLPGLQPQIPLWYATLVISRDVMLVIGYFVILHFKGRMDVQPRLAGKCATVCQMSVIVWALAQMWPQHFMSMVVAAAVLTLISGLQYIWDGVHQLDRPAPPG